MKLPLGKGYFVWQLNLCAGGDPGRMAAMCQAAGVKWVSFKTHNGVYTRNGDLRYHARALRNAGVSVWTWGYCYGTSPMAESRIAIRRAVELDADGYMLNAEKEYKEPGMGLAARVAMATFRAEAPDLSVGLCSYRFPTLHRTLPWLEFINGGIAFHNPQVYWLENDETTAPIYQLARCLEEMRNLSPTRLPIIPLGVASPNDENTWRVHVPQLNAFAAAVRSASLDGYGWWSWEHAERRGEVWAAIAAHDAAPPPSSGSARQRLLAGIAALRREIESL